MCLMALTFGVSTAKATPIRPTNVMVSTPGGTNDPTNPYTDDVLMDQLVFGAVNFRRIDNAFRAVQYAKVYFNRSSVNAEFGDNDDGNDGNPNPFVAAGLLAPGQALTDATRESTVPGVQDAAIRAAFSTFSISQGVDGEGPDYSIDLIFTQGIVDSNPNRTNDGQPELIFFERGLNSDFRIQVILGGNVWTPILSDPFDVLQATMWATGIQIDTIEINPAQQLGAIGLDLGEFRRNGARIGNSPVYGIRVTSINGTGADFDGIFASALNQNQFVDVYDDMFTPEPGNLTLLGSALVALAGLGWRRKLREKRGPGQ